MWMDSAHCCLWFFKDVRGTEIVSIRVHDTRDEEIFMTMTLCRAIVFC